MPAVLVGVLPGKTLAGIDSRDKLCQIIAQTGLLEGNYEELPLNERVEKYPDEVIIFDHEEYCKDHAKEER
ncbi:MAG TPA: hypothetical protein VMW83_00240 [Spirochaetia bacterium]|nr:hypothetical protein [Spirochaetia bacterium]